MTRKPRFRVMTVLALLASGAAFPGTSASLDRQLRKADPGPPYLLSADCTLEAFDTCSGWIWVFDDAEGAVWGAIFDPDDCPGGCLNGAWLTEIVLYSHCATTPGRMGGVGVARVDALGCRTSLLYESGPVTVVHCTSGDRWTIFAIPVVQLLGRPFAVTVTWGSESGGTSNLQFASDNGIANLYCRRGETGTFPGCAMTSLSCAGWVLPAQNSFIYVTDINGDGLLDDLCAMYGAPYPLSFPYEYPYGYLPNNLLISVGMDCSSPQPVEASSWGRVKSLFQ